MTRDKLLERLLHNWPAKILSLAAAIVLFFFASIFGMTEFQVSVPINYLLPEGFVPAQETVTQARLIFKGDTRHIEMIKSLNLKSEDFRVSAIFAAGNGAGEQNVNLAVQMTRSGEDLSRLGFERIEPSRITLSLEPVSFKTVRVDYQVSGKPALGYQLGKIQLNPSTVRIEGPKRHLENVSSLQTEAIDLNEKDTNFIQKYRVISTDPLIRIRPIDRVQAEIELLRNFDDMVFGDLKIDLIGLRPDLQMQGITSRGFMRVRTNRGANGTGIATVQLPKMFVDCSSVNASGTYSLPVQTQIPEGMELMEHIPRALTIDFIVTLAGDSQ